jgi:hypothetical protein
MLGVAEQQHSTICCLVSVLTCSTLLLQVVYGRVLRTYQGPVLAPSTDQKGAYRRCCQHISTVQPFHWQLLPLVA